MKHGKELKKIMLELSISLRDFSLFVQETEGNVMALFEREFTNLEFENLSLRMYLFSYQRETKNNNKINQMAVDELISLNRRIFIKDESRDSIIDYTTELKNEIETLKTEINRLTDQQVKTILIVSKKYFSISSLFGFKKKNKPVLLPTEIEIEDATKIYNRSMNENGSIIFNPDAFKDGAQWLKNTLLSK